MSDTIKMIPTSQILPPWVQLRPVRMDTVEWLEMQDSILKDGILNSILVRPHPTREGYYEVIDGNWRYFSCKSLDIPEIPCILKVDVSDDKVLELQIAGNAVSYETRPVEFAEQMQRMLRVREQAGAPMTLTELSGMVSKSVSWVSKRLKLLSLCETVKKALRNGDITLGHAVALARVRLPKYQVEFLSKAKELRVRDFELEVGKWIALKRHEKMGERREDRDEINLKPRLRSMDALLMELDNLDEISQIIVRKNLTTPLQGAKAMLEWILNLDSAGREKQVRELRHKLSKEERKEIIGRQRYEELKALRIEREKRNG